MGGERTAVAGRSGSLALEIGTMRESDPTHGAKMLLLALASEGSLGCIGEIICTSG
jgi:hypothetical protein